MLLWFEGVSDQAQVLRVWKMKIKNVNILSDDLKWCRQHLFSSATFSFCSKSFYTFWTTSGELMYWTNQSEQVTLDPAFYGRDSAILKEWTSTIKE